MKRELLLILALCCFSLSAQTLSQSSAAVSPPAQWNAPTEPARYDWRGTRWMGLAGGTVTGTGLCLRDWGEHNGWQFTLLPMIIEHKAFLLIAGGARLFSLNEPPAAAAGPWGFTRRHYFWFLSTAHGFTHATNDGSAYLGAVSGGFGVDLDRRVSRFSLMLGLGPYLSLGSRAVTSLNLYPTFELNWHFGAPRRVVP